MVQEKAEGAERERFGGKHVWKCIRDMLHGERGRRPMRVVQVDDEEGRPCVTVKDQSERWRRHSRKVLNTESQFIESELDRVKQRPCDESIEGLPDKREVKRALGKLKNGKAPG